MPIQPTYPGVYVQEEPSGVRTIVGVSTSVAAFIDYFKRGLMNYPIQLFNMGDFEREFGGLDKNSEASYAIQQFFLNGGTEAWVVRTASGSYSPASVEIQSSAGGATALEIVAGRFDPVKSPQTINPGTWGNDLRVMIDYPEPISNNRFNLTILLVENRNGREVVLQTELFRGLSMDANDTKFVETVLNDRFTGSQFVRVTAHGTLRPLQTGTVSGVLPATINLTDSAPELNITIGTDGTATIKFPKQQLSLEEARRMIETAIRAAKPECSAFSQATVSICDSCLRIKAGPTSSQAVTSFAASGIDTSASDLGLLTGNHLNGILTGDFSAGGVSFPTTAGTLDVTIGGSTSSITLLSAIDFDALRVQLETEIRAVAAGVLPADQPAFSNVRLFKHTVGPVTKLLVLAGEPGKDVTFADSGSDTLASDLMLCNVLHPPQDIIVYCSDNLATIPTIAAGDKIIVTIGGAGPYIAGFVNAAGSLITVAAELQTAIRAAHATAAFTDTIVLTYSAAGENRLIVLGGIVSNQVVFTNSPADATTLDELKLRNAANNCSANIQRYTLGAGAPIANSAQGAAATGASGDLPDANALIGDFGSKTGIYALENVDLFNILCIPRTANVGTDAGQLSETEYQAVIQTANAYCEKKRAFFIMDTRIGINNFQDIKTWTDTNSTVRHRNSALYFPRIEIPDPLNEFHPRSIGASGTMAGLYAKTDSNRGVWKAPAGIEAKLVNILKLEYNLSDNENGALNPLAINCLRNFPVFGCVSWGARTLDGADQMASEWKYIPVRRLALYLEESLYRGLKWVVFEPNDEPLWSQIRLNAGAFMHNLFIQGAFQGQSPKEAYFVKCDKETTTQNDINLGIVNIWVGFAPLKPAEFVILHIQQMAGQINQ